MAKKTITPYNYIADIVDRILESARTMEQVASWFYSPEAKQLRPIDIARVSMLMMSRMRGGRIGAELAKPEILFCAVNEASRV